MVFLALTCRNPHLVLIGILVELAIFEIAPQQAELPHVVGDVLPYVADRPVGTHDDLLIFLRYSQRQLCVLCATLRVLCGFRFCRFWLLRSPRSPHHPAALILALGFVEENAGVLQLRERRIPKMQMQNLALPRQEVVLDVEPVHGFQMPAQHGHRDHVRDGGGLVPALLDLMQSLHSCMQVLLVLAVPMRDPRIEIPAVVVKARLSRELLDFGA